MLRRYAWNVLIALDQLGNALAGGDPDETISSRIGKVWRRRRRPDWRRYPLHRALGWVLEKWDPGHLRRAIEDDEGEDAVRRRRD
jgi:hypothetical protein